MVPLPVKKKAANKELPSTARLTTFARNMDAVVNSANNIRVKNATSNQKVKAVEKVAK